jgi:hypothetical protein
MTLTVSVVEQVVQMLANGDNHSVISRALGISRGAVRRIHLGTHHHQRPKPDRKPKPPPGPAGPAVRCPGCGAAAAQPCHTCRTRAQFPDGTRRPVANEEMGAEIACRLPTELDAERLRIQRIKRANGEPRC